MLLSLDQTSDGGSWHEQEVRRVPSTHSSPALAFSSDRSSDPLFSLFFFSGVFGAAAQVPCLRWDATTYTSFTSVATSLSLSSLSLLCVVPQEEAFHPILI
jgi:hypothetical protein